jgi:elongation factor P
MDDNLITLMDVENYEQVEIGKEVFADKIDLLQDGMIITVESYEEQPINIILPESINLEVVEAEPVIKGQTATASFKPAIMANGLRIMVPPFINVGDLITIRTADRTYLERAKV